MDPVILYAMKRYEEEEFEEDEGYFDEDAAFEAQRDGF